MLKFIKGDSVKFIDPASALIPQLRADGWALEDELKQDDPVDRDALVAEAQALGLSFHPNIGAKKLALLIAEAKNGNGS